MERALPGSARRGAFSGVTALFGSGQTWAFGPGGVFLPQWDGAAWRTALAADGVVTGAWGAAPNDIWTITQGGIGAHWDGISWSATSQRTPDLSIVAANSLGQVWALGKQWDALRSQGDAVTPLNLSGIPDGQPRTVWVSDEGEASLGINPIYNGQSELFGISVDGKVRRIASVSGSVSRISSACAPSPPTWATRSLRSGAERCTAIVAT